MYKYMILYTICIYHIYIVIYIYIYIYIFVERKFPFVKGFLCSRHKQIMLFNNLHNPINWLLTLFPLTLEATDLKKLSEFYAISQLILSLEVGIRNPDTGHLGQAGRIKSCIESPWGHSPAQHRMEQKERKRGCFIRHSRRGMIWGFFVLWTVKGWQFTVLHYFPYSERSRCQTPAARLQGLLLTTSSCA